MTAMDGLPKLSEIINTHGLAAKKNLGQNFLLDLNLTSRIARQAGDLSEHTILEVGPGPGGLTRALLLAGARKVIAIERDERCIPVLDQIRAHYPDRFDYVLGDALQTGLEELTTTPVKVVANLPYNIATPLLTKWVGAEPWPPQYSSLTLMFQKEVAERICAMPGDKAYGRLSVLTNWRCHCDLAFDVSPKAFTPPPKVTSSIVHLVPKENLFPASRRDLELVTQHAFGQRRKMLRASLKKLGGEKLLEKAGIDGQLRAENLSVEQFVAIANKLHDSK